jgi:hypothetical protein
MTNLKKIQIGGIVKITAEQAQDLDNIDYDQALKFGEIVGFPHYLEIGDLGTTSCESSKGILLILSSVPIPWSQDDDRWINKRVGFQHADLLK